jgi:hypothetical protein
VAHVVETGFNGAVSKTLEVTIYIYISMGMKLHQRDLITTHH